LPTSSPTTEASSQRAQRVIVSGVPVLMRRASQVMARVLRRMLPWDAAVPRAPVRWLVPWRAI
jgi:hypothetical protein